MDSQKSAKTPPKLDNAISNMKRQLRAESKAYLINSWIGLYAQVIKQSHEIEILNGKLKQITESSDSVADGSGGPKGEEGA